MHNPDTVADEPIRFNAALDVDSFARTRRCSSRMTSSRLQRRLVIDRRFPLVMMARSVAPRRTSFRTS